MPVLVDLIYTLSLMLSENVLPFGFIDFGILRLN